MPALLSARVAGCLVAGAMAAMAASPALAAAASGATETAYAAHAFGSSVQLGNLAAQGATADVPLCTKNPGVTVNDSTAYTLTLPLPGGTSGSLGVATTSVASSAPTSTKVQSVGTSQTGATSLVDGLISFSGLQMTAKVTRSGTSYTTSGSATFTGLQVAGFPSIVASPKPNTTIPIPLLGTLVLNQQTSSVRGGIHSESLTALRLTINATPNVYNLPAGIITVGHADASLHEPVHHMASGSAYGTSIGIGGSLSSARTASVAVPCGGSGGLTGTGKTKTVDVPNALSTGTSTSTEVSQDSSTATSATTTSSTSDVNLFNGVITATSVKAQAHTSRAGSKVTSSSSGTTIANLMVNGKAYTVTAPTTITVDRYGALYVDQAVKSATGIQVYALQLVLTSKHAGLKAGTTITVGSARTGVAA